jgi:hypothetical protein
MTKKGKQMWMRRIFEVGLQNLVDLVGCRQMNSVDLVGCCHVMVVNSYCIDYLIRMY